MKLYPAKIRRDAHTTTPVNVPEHEVPILQEIFGEENVQTPEGLSVAEHGLGEPVGEMPAQDDEFGRLSAKYGAKVVEEVYGKKASRGLETAMKEIAAKEAKLKASDKPSTGLNVDEIKAELAKRQITIPEGVSKKAELAKLLDDSEKPAE